MKSGLRALESVAVAFSAGVDSTFLLKVAVDTLGPDKVIAVTADSDSLARAEFEEAVKLAEGMGARHAVIKTGEFDDPNYLANPANRCYYCKNELFGKLGEFIAEHGLKAVVAGVNADDYADWRPGIQAGREHHVYTPCADAGLTKQDIRALSRRMGLPTYDKPAMPCLASRIPYGEAITPEKLKMIERGEALLREMGFPECRVRHHQNLARIEVPAGQIEILCRPETRQQVESAFRDIGYAYVAVDLRGFRSGSMNEVIAFGQKTPAE
ncbi:MAG: ATP-dependent sacrificial sulfur transferase LarE [Phycisphaerales bacterium]|nr:ATP-dependent sacrificial sulfur transferase LarE [Phycisphaerales bacterium]